MEKTKYILRMNPTITVDVSAIAYNTVVGLLDDIKNAMGIDELMNKHQSLLTHPQIAVLVGSLRNQKSDSLTERVLYDALVLHYCEINYDKQLMLGAIEITDETLKERKILHALSEWYIQTIKTARI